MTSLPQYLDYAATTPTDPIVLEAMLPYFLAKFGNPASRTHSYGAESLEATKNARSKVAKLIKAAKSEDIIFTSGATEAINLAIKGVYESYQEKGNHIITTSVEHKAVLDTCAYLEKKGARVTYLPVDRNGVVDLDALRSSVTPETILISAIYVNNETGVIQPIREIADIAEANGVLFMSDATQAVGKIPVDVEKDGIDLLTCSAHKIYGPNGVGALYVKSKYPRIKLTPQMHGGGHESGFRSGTLNTPAIVGFGEAARLAAERFEADYSKARAFRLQIEKVLKSFPNCVIHAESTSKAANIISFYFKGIDAEALVIQLRDRLALSVGSACTSREVLPSHVIMSMYGNEDIAFSTLRLSTGRFTEDDAPERIHEAFDHALQEVTRYI